MTPSERREAIVRADKRHVWHPYTAMRAYIDEIDPLVIARAEGARFYDVDGRTYLDGNASWYVSALGHNHPRLVAALARQAEAFCHIPLAGVTHEPAAQLAAELVAVAPGGLEHVFYTDDGSTAVESALKMSAQYYRNTGRPRKKRFVSLVNAYHGDTIGAASVGGVEVFRKPFAGLLLDCIHVPPPTADDPRDERAPAAAFDRLAEVLAHEDVAAVILEPRVQAVAGMRIYDPKYLATARALCDEHDALLVCDEVFTGYGRTGPMWAGSDARPDLMCIAKGFTGGLLPMAATLATRRVFEAFLGDKERAFFYGHSYCGNPLGAAVAREVLAIYRDERVLERAAPKANRIANAFERLAAEAGGLRWRAIGMIGALDLAEEASYLGRAGWRVFDEARRRGAYLRPLGDTVYVTPAINIDDGDLDELLAIVRESVLAVIGG